MMRRKALAWVVALVAAALLPRCAAAADFLEVLPAETSDPRVPDAASVWGFGWGEDVPDAEQVVLYARRLADAAPDRVKVIEYAKSLEGRPLILLVVAAPGSMERLPAVRAQLMRLADPRKVAPSEAEGLLDEVPAIVWIAGSVHGDEASGGDAALALAYHLVANTSAESAAILSETVVVIDPQQNPDGRARFVAALRQARGTAADAEPASAEHVQPWPGGRFSHDLFDLNRDWFVLSHPETAGRVAAMNEWYPVVSVDLHEMGAEQGYFFPPPAPPYHPLLSGSHLGMWDVLGRSIAAAFDQRGWRYWTRELFDSFYPGYGETWPSLTGSVGMTFEQASARGTVTRLEDGSLLTHRDAVRHHLLASFTTCLTVARQPERFVRAWHAFRRQAVRDGGQSALALSCAEDPARAAELAGLLARQGVEVWRRSVTGRDGAEEYVVPLGQPLGYLARALLDRQAAMGEAFEREQVRRDKKRLPDQIYDVTAWSMPLLWGVSVSAAAGRVAGEGFEPVSAEHVRGGTVTGNGQVAFLVPWTGIGSARLLAGLLGADVRVGVAAKPMTVGGRRFDGGTLVVRASDQPEGLRVQLQELAKRCGVDVFGVDSGYADEGIDIGSGSVYRLRAPRVAVAWDTPTAAPSAGQIRHGIERIIGYPVTAVRTATLQRADLQRFDVIVLPDTWGAGSGYPGALGEGGVARLAQWVREGGVLIGVGEGGRFLCEEKVGLLASRAEKRDAAGGAVEARPEKVDKAFDLDSHVIPESEDPPSVPGAILRVRLDGEHLLAAGFPSGTVDVLANSRRVLLPLKLDKGVNVGVYAAAPDLVQAGFILDSSRQLLPQKGYLLVQEHGRGRVVAFAEDPSMRALTRSSLLLLANAVFFGGADGGRR